jgi:hypothetical protein
VEKLWKSSIGSRSAVLPESGRWEIQRNRRMTEAARRVQNAFSRFRSGEMTLVMRNARHFWRAFHLNPVIRRVMFIGRIRFNGKRNR